jgi:1,4-dihydroxy-2-naphthoyl-CoA hydrolase
MPFLSKPYNLYYMTHSDVTPEQLNLMSKGTLVEHLGIELTEIGPDYLTGKMPVDSRTKQPLGLLHGGASVALAETLGSLAANFSVNPDTHYCVGLDINANHVRSASEGWVYGKATALHIGKNTQVWEIRITNEAGQLICISRLTMAVLTRKV